MFFFFLLIPETHTCEYKTKDNHLKEEKADQNKLTLNNEASLNFFDEGGNSISQAKVDNYEKVHDLDGNQIPLYKDKHGKIIPWAEIENYNELYDEYGNMVEHKVKPKQMIQNALFKVRTRDEKFNVQAYDNLGKPIPASIVDAADQIFDKKGNFIQRIFDRDGKPIDWSQMSFVDETYDKNGKLISHGYDHNGSRISWSDNGNTKTVYDNSGNIIPQVYDNHGNPQLWSKFDESGKFYHENGEPISQVLDKNEHPTPKSTKIDFDNSEYNRETNSEINESSVNLYDNQGKPIPRSQVAKFNEVYNKFGNSILLFYDKDGNTTASSNADADKVNRGIENRILQEYDKDSDLIPLSDIDETNKFYDETGQQVPKNYDNETQSRLLIQKISHDNEEHPINGSKEDDFPGMYDEHKKRIPRNPIFWSNADADKVNDMILNLIPQVYDKDENLMQHSNIDEADKFCDKTGQQVTKHYGNKTKSIFLMQKISYINEEHPKNASNEDDFLEIRDENKNEIPLHPNKWSKVDEQGKLYEKYGNDLDKRKLQGSSFDYRQSQHISSSVFKDMSRSFSLPKRSSTEPENLKTLDWVVQRELEYVLLLF